MLSQLKKGYVVYSIGAGLILTALTLIGCATIMHGTSQDIGITSQPIGATVTIDNMSYGQTPVIAKLSRKDNHTVNLDLKGYQPFAATITRSTSGWVWGNILFGGLIGLAVDAISGGLYKLQPEQIEAQMVGKSMGGALKGSDIIITFVLEPDPSWEKVGNLTPAIE